MSRFKRVSLIASFKASYNRIAELALRRGTSRAALKAHFFSIRASSSLVQRPAGGGQRGWPHRSLPPTARPAWILFVSGLIVAGTIARDMAWELWLALEETLSLDAEPCPGEGATLQSLPAPSLLGWRAGSLLPFPPPCQRAFGQGRERLVPRQVPRFHLDVLEVQGPHSQHCVCHSWTQTEGELSVKKAAG